MALGFGGEIENSVSKATVVINDDEVQKLMKDYKKIKKYMKSSLYQVKTMEGTETRVKKLLDEYKIKGQVFKSVGCDECDNTGYKGRLIIGEFVSIDEKISDLIHNSASENEISYYVYKNNKKIYLIIFLLKFLVKK